MKNVHIGSVWRQWDLHFHTPSSYDYQNGGVTDADIVDALIQAAVSVVAVTDHHIIDVSRITNLRSIAGDTLTVLPGIEFRSELGGKPIHYIGIFPETADVQEIWDMVRGALRLTEKQVSDKGDDKVYTNIKDAYQIITELGGIISIHAGGKSNSIEGIRNTEQFQQRIKYDITCQYISLLEVGQIRDVHRYLRKVFPVTGLDLPIIVGSDNHDAHNYATPVNCWLKADPTFLGLRQVCNEPRDRVYLGKRPPQLERIDANKTRIVKSLRFTKRPSASLSEEWFSDVAIDFNPGLVAIIGNKGNGKSALTDVLGLVGDCPHEQSFAFLHEEQFRHPQHNKAQYFDATLTWSSGKALKRNLTDSYEPGSIESIRYIPQLYLEEICDELKGGHEGRFDRELRRVIFSRIPEEQRLGQTSLESLIALRTGEINGNIEITLDQLNALCEKAAILQEQSTEEYQRTLTQQLAAIEEEMESHKNTKPKDVKPPGNDPDQKTTIDKMREQLEAKKKSIAALSRSIDDTKSTLTTTVSQHRASERLIGALNNLRRTYDDAIDKAKTDCAELGLEAEQLVQLTINLEPVTERRNQLRKEQAELESRLDPENPKGLTATHARSITERDALIEKLDQPARDYEAYQEQLEEWQVKHDSLVGNENTLNTQVYCTQLLKEAADAPKRLKETVEAMNQKAMELFELKMQILQVYQELHTPVQDFIDRHPIAKERFGLEFRVSLVPSSFEEQFLSFIHQGRTGSFYGEQEGFERLRELVRKTDFQSNEKVRAFLEDVLDRLKRDYRAEERPDIALSHQMRKGRSTEELYAFLFGLNYLAPRYELQWEGKPLTRLSPGERGILLLIFFLLIDDSKLPLVIDQPEGNLDNQTVYELLVGCIKEAKDHRQVILVTHNPNLAVVCDADQVIHASLEKDGAFQLNYDCGALENPEMCRRIVDILEGTKPAIDNRVAKYHLIFDDQMPPNKPMQTAGRGRLRGSY